MPSSLQADAIISLNSSGVDELSAFLKEYPNRLNRAISVSINQTMNEHDSEIVDRIAEDISIPRSEIADKIGVRIRSTKNNLEGMIRVSESPRLSLKRFNPVQTSSGVSYQVSRTRGRQLAQSSFGPNISKLGRHVYKRVGRSRLPIRRLKGVSIWGYYKQNKLLVWSDARIRRIFKGKVERRIRKIKERAFTTPIRTRQFTRSL